MRIGGVASPDNESDILTKYLQPPLHIKHTQQLHILKNTTLTNCVLTLNHGPRRDDEQAPPRRHLTATQQLPLNPPQQETSPRRNIIANANTHENGGEILPQHHGRSPQHHGKALFSFATILSPYHLSVGFMTSHR